MLRTVGGWITIDVPPGARCSRRHRSDTLQIVDHHRRTIMTGLPADVAAWEHFNGLIDALPTDGMDDAERLRRGPIPIGAWRGRESLIRSVASDRTLAAMRLPLISRVLMRVMVTPAFAAGPDYVRWLLALEHVPTADPEPDGTRPAPPRVILSVTAYADHLDEPHWHSIIESMRPVTP